MGKVGIECPYVGGTLLRLERASGQRNLRPSRLGCWGGRRDERKERKSSGKCQLHGYGKEAGEVAVAGRPTKFMEVEAQSLYTFPGEEKRR